MAEAQEIPLRLATSVSRHLSVSTSPTAAFHSPGGSFGGALSRTATGPTQRELKPFDTTDIKILLLENVNQSGQDILSSQGYQVESLKSSLPEEQLIEKIR
jgi:D-3-phosphoglycerate dehydrogenase